MSATREALANVLASSGTRRIGALVFWTLERVQIDRTTFRDELVELGLDAAMGRDPTSTKLLSNAMARVMVRRPNLIARHLGKSWAIVAEASSVAEENKVRVLDYDHFLTVTPGDGVVEHEYPQGEDHAIERLAVFGAADLLSQIRTEFERAKQFMDTAELSGILVGMMNGTARKPLLAAVSLRERTGGLYFVEASVLDLTLKVAALVKRYCASSEVNVFTLTGEADNLRQAAQAAKRGFSNQLNDLRSEVADFKAALVEKTKVASDRNLQVRAERFNLLRDRVQLFAGLLGDLSAELTSEIETTRDALLKDLKLV